MGVHPAPAAHAHNFDGPCEVEGCDSPGLHTAQARAAYVPPKLTPLQTVTTPEPPVAGDGVLAVPSDTIEVLASDGAVERVRVLARNARVVLEVDPATGDGLFAEVLNMSEPEAWALGMLALAKCRAARRFEREGK